MYLAGRLKHRLTRTVDRLVGLGEATLGAVAAARGASGGPCSEPDPGVVRPASSASGPLAPASARDLAPAGPAGQLARRLSLGTVGALLDALASDEVRAVRLGSDVGRDVARAVARGLVEGATARPRAGPSDEPGGRSRTGEATDRARVEQDALEDLAARLAAGAVEGAMRRAGPLLVATSSLGRGLVAGGAAGVRALVNAVIDVAVERHDDLARLSSELARDVGAAGSLGAVETAIGAAPEQSVPGRGRGVAPDEGLAPQRPPRRDVDRLRARTAPRAPGGAAGEPRPGALAAVSELGRAATTGAAQGVRAELSSGARLGVGVALPVLVGVVVGAGGAAAWSAWRAGPRASSAR